MRKLILYGSGELGRKWLKKLGHNRVFRFADSDPVKVGQVIDGIECCGIRELKERKMEIAIFPSVSEKYIDEVKKILEINNLEDVIVNSPYSIDIVHACNDSKFDVDTTFEGDNFLDSGSAVMKCYMGYASYIAKNTVLYQTKIGKYSAIGPEVSIIRGQHPVRKFVSVHPAFYSPYNEVTRVHYCDELLYEEFRYTKNGYAVEIGNDVWIGKGVQIMEGTSIGDGAIVAAGGVVVKDVLPFTIVGGVPAKVIRNRFRQEERDFLKQLQWWDKPEQWIQKYSIYFQDIKLLMSILEEKK